MKLRVTAPDARWERPKVVPIQFDIVSGTADPADALDPYGAATSEHGLQPARTACGMSRDGDWAQLLSAWSSAPTPRAWSFSRISRAKKKYGHVRSSLQRVGFGRWV